MNQINKSIKIQSNSTKTLFNKLISQLDKKKTTICRLIKLAKVTNMKIHKNV